ncbi:rhamnan synthesis F family protein [Agrococcus beijingensis]|uniref:rhamnan synthesis F family protein n=1 Tax=Agrococcus beijingensis TaxID=3068634 RepID=UPI00274217D2|nr:rhamnan synthesis F family protein [Agrococcus sp. REN33]
MTRPSVAVLRVGAQPGSRELVMIAVERLRARFERVLVVGDAALAEQTGADASQGSDWIRDSEGARELLLADDAWIGPLDDPAAWRAPVDGVAALVDHPESWLLAAGAGVDRLRQGSGADRPPLHPWADLDVLAATAPLLPLEAFAAPALDLDAEGLVMPRVADALSRRGVPRDAVARALAHVALPRDLSTNLGLVEIVTDEAPVATHPPLSIVVIMHVHYVDMLDELLARADHLPGHRLVVTTSDASRGRQLEARLAELGRPGEVRVAASNRGRDISAFLLGCRDLLDDPTIDLVVKLHSKRSPQVGGATGRSFAALLLDNLLPGPGHAARLVALFAADPRLGIAFGPMVHAGYPTTGRAWFTNRPRTQEVADRLGIDTPLDETSPIAPYGSMFIARPAALRPLVAGGLTWEEFPTEGEYRDGSLAHVVERLFVPAALSAGYSFRTVLSSRWAAASHAMLEHKLDDAESSLERRFVRKSRRVPWKLGQVARSVRLRRR